MKVNCYLVILVVFELGLGYIGVIFYLDFKSDKKS